MGHCVLIRRKEYENGNQYIAGNNVTRGVGQRGGKRGREGGRGGGGMAFFPGT